ncbi:hypothetical protein [Thiocystis violacea]|uniref:hypothetical protein n=1 Tax=Thiocystis violacea TaxID=13725 RepID=UPI0019045F44|nr:hypothetical protein [Thiocystis violacea]
MHWLIYALIGFIAVMLLTQLFTLYGVLSPNPRKFRRDYLSITCIHRLSRKMVLLLASAVSLTASAERNLLIVSDRQKFLGLSRISWGKQISSKTNT